MFPCTDQILLAKHIDQLPMAPGDCRAGVCIAALPLLSREAASGLLASRARGRDRDCSPKSPLSRASARGGLRSFSKESSCGLASNMSRRSAGLSKPCGVEGRSGEDWRAPSAAGDGWGCWDEVPGTAMLLKSIRGKPGVG